MNDNSMILLGVVALLAPLWLPALTLFAGLLVAVFWGHLLTRGSAKEPVALIEMPKGTKVKWEVDSVTHRLRADRTLNVAVPQNYGWVKGTKAPDGDALDVFVVTLEALDTFDEVPILIKGAFICKDDGVLDEKLIALPKDNAGAPLAFATDRIKTYLETYKPGFEVLEYVGQKEAYEIIRKYRK